MSASFPSSIYEEHLPEQKQTGSVHVSHPPRDRLLAVSQALSEAKNIEYELTLPFFFIKIWWTRKKEKSSLFGHSGESRNPVDSIRFGCRIKSGMTILRLFTKLSNLDSRNIFLFFTSGILIVVDHLENIKTQHIGSLI